MSHNNFVTIIFHTHLCHTSSFTLQLHKILCHTSTLLHIIFHTHTPLSHQLCHTSLSYIIFHTHTFVTLQLCRQLCHTSSFTHKTTTLSHILFHTQLCHTSSLTHNLVTHHLSHTPASHSNFVTHHLSHNNFVTNPLSHTASWQAWHLVTSSGTLSHILFHTQLMALGDIYLRFARQAWYRLHLVARLVAVGRRWSPVTPRHFAWQAWHLATSIFVSCSRRPTWRHPPAFHVAGVALGDIYLRFVWQVWYRLHLVARLVAVGRW